MKLQPVRGTRDLIAQEARLFREIDEKLSRTARLYDFQEIVTPVLEFTSVFKRSLGGESDIVSKEMYSFEDRSGDSLTLRPEGTASVARAVISNSMLRDLPLKLFYSGPMFRHERPQKGRYRQFNQLGVELIGVDQPLADIEVLSLAWQFLRSCDLHSKVQLEINTIGDKQSRQAYQTQLVEYLSQHKNKLSTDSQRRLTTNPLRVLDSKDEKDQEIVAKAPNFADHLNDESKSIFQEIRKGLDELKIPYILNPRLVRGLDYYDHCVFEFTTNALGSQNAILSGGRYNGLVESMGGPATPGVGWAAGTDRIALLLEKPELQHATVALITPQAGLEEERLKLLQELRDNTIPSQVIYSGNLSKQLKKASKRNCHHAIILGEEELNKAEFVVKDLVQGSQESLSRTDLIAKLKSYYA